MLRGRASGAGKRPRPLPSPAFRSLKPGPKRETNPSAHAPPWRSQRAVWSGDRASDCLSLGRGNQTGSDATMRSLSSHLCSLSLVPHLSNWRVIYLTHQDLIKDSDPARKVAAKSLARSRRSLLLLPGVARAASTFQSPFLACSWGCTGVLVPRPKTLNSAAFPSSPALKDWGNLLGLHKTSFANSVWSYIVALSLAHSIKAWCHLLMERLALTSTAPLLVLCLSSEPTPSLHRTPTFPLEEEFIARPVAWTLYKA